MNSYTIDLAVKVLLNLNFVVYDVDIIKITVQSRNKQNAVLKAFKLLDLETVKFIRKNTIKYEWQADWDKAIGFEIMEVKNVQVNAQP